MSQVIRPTLPDLVRTKGSTVDEVAQELLTYHNQDSARWSYKTGIRTVQAAYKGLHDIKLLLPAADREKIKQGRSCNLELIKYAAPFAFGRNTQVFQLESRKFAFGRDRYAAFRIPFFFVEGGIVKIYYVQPRRTVFFEVDELSMLATIHKRYLLDTEFFGEEVDVEYIELGPTVNKGPREPRRYTLKDLELWSERRLVDRLTILAAGLEKAESSGLAKAKKRVPQRTQDMPLFD